MVTQSSEVGGQKPDASADALAERLGGESRVKFESDPEGREFDAVRRYTQRYSMPTVIDIEPLTVP